MTVSSDTTSRSDHLQLQEEAASPLGVSALVHRHDHIFEFLINHKAFPSDQTRIGYYFSDGAKSAGQLDELVEKHLPGKATPVSLLEFASGYGCVGRHLKNNPRFDLTACDIHDEAISFMETQLAIRAVQSQSQPECLTLPQAYDVVFALSFFSHMPITTWARWLVRLVQAAKVGGLVIFTTHGEHSRKYLGKPKIGELGFHFQRNSEQKDLPLDEYGNTTALPAFVRAVIATIPQAIEIEFGEGFWWGHQDMYVLQKVADL